MSSPTAATVALLSYLLFGILGFGWRSLRHRRETGSSGFAGIGDRPGSAQWLAGLGFVAALVSCVAAPVVQLTGVLRPLRDPVPLAVEIVGLVVMLAGLTGTLAAQLEMGRSWRVGVDPTQSTDLVRGGSFALVRNPIYTAMLVFAAGTCLIAPNAVAIAGFAALFIAVEVHVRAVEEPYLQRVHGAAYQSYARDVGRFVPGLGRG